LYKRQNLNYLSPFSHHRAGIQRSWCCAPRLLPCRFPQEDGGFLPASELVKVEGQLVRWRGWEKVWGDGDHPHPYRHRIYYPCCKLMLLGAAGCCWMLFVAWY